MKKTLTFLFVVLCASFLFAQTTIDFDNALNWTIGSDVASLTSYSSLHTYVDGVFSATGGPALRNATTAQDGFPGALGTYSWRLSNVTTVEWIMTIASGGVSTFSLDIRRWDGIPSPNYNLDYSTDGGTIWTNVTTINNAALDESSAWKTFNGSINSANTNIKIRLIAMGTTERIMVDNFVWTGSGGTIIVPTVQTFSISFSNIQSLQMDVNWTNGDGSRRVVIMNTTNSFTNPTDGTDPAANAVYGGSGEQVVYNGSGNSLTVSGLTASTTYWFRAYEFNGSGTGTLFLTTTATGNPNSQITSAGVALPTVTTTAISAITENSASGGGNVTSDGGGAITDRGICWATTANPTTANFTYSNGAGTTGAYTSPLTGLNPSQLYYVRAYAINSAGTAYGNEVSFTTNNPALTLPLTENFNYTVGTLLTANGWTNHSGTSNFIPVDATDLSYPSYPFTGGGSASLLTTGEDVHVNFTTQTAGSVYSSLLINVSASQTTGDYVFHFGTNPWSTSFLGRVFVKKDATTTNFAFGLNKGTAAATVYTGFDYLVDTTYLLVLKYTFVDGITNDEVKLFINPVISATEPAADITVSTTDTFADATNIGGIALRQGTATNAPTALIDGIRVATTWEQLFQGTTYTGTIVVDPATLNSFSTIVGSESAEQSYQLYGIDLTSNDIDVTVTGPFQISNVAAGGWGTELHLLSAMTYDIAVKYVPTEAGTQTGTITHSVLDGEAAPVFISLSGTATPATQTITVTPLTMTFTTNSGTSSSAQMAIVDGVNLVTGITVASSGEYSFSATEGGTYSNPYQITTGYNGTSNVWIKFSPTTIGTFNNTITFNSGTAEEKVIAVTGYSLDPNATYATDLFFSEYIEGSSNNKAIEIFNGTGHDVDLADYTVYLYSNGAGASTPTNTLAMTGILANNDVYIIANASANATILALADVTSSVTFYNGDDALGLWKESTAAYVDIFGVIGSDPGTAWIDGSHTTLDRTLIRKSSVIGGVTINPSGTGPLAFTTLTTEWDVYAIDTISNLGTHYFTPGLLPAEAPVIMPAGGVQVGPITVSMSTTTPGGVIWYTLDGTDPTNAAPSIMYTVSFGISVDTTVKARTFATGFAYSPITTVVYTFPVITNVPNIAALRALTPGTGAYYKLTGEAILTLKSSSRNSKYIQDATGAVLIDDPTGKITTIYNLGDGITNVIGTLALYNSMLQFTPATDPGPATSTGNIVVPLEVTTLDIADATYQAKLVKLSGVTITGTGNFLASTSYPIADAAGVGTLRDQYPDLDYIGTPIPTTPKDIVGVMLQNLTVMQFIPRSLAEFTDSASLDAPVTAIFLTGGQVELSWAAITGATGYKVYATDDPYVTFPGAWTLLTPTPITALTYTYTGTENYKFFKVTANN